MPDKKINRWLFIALWLTSTVIFIALGVWIILSASGLAVNWRLGTITKTGLILVESEPKSARVVVDGKTVALKTPARIANLLPGTHDLQIESIGRQTWEKRVVIEGGMAQKYLDIILPLKQPVAVDVSEREKEELDKTILPSDIEIYGTEIRNIKTIEKILITRLSTPVKFTNWYPDKKHLLYQTDKKIYIIDSDGSNPRVLVELENADPSLFYITDGGDSLVYKDGNNIKKVTIK